MCFVACSDGASGELSATLCTRPTSSSCGTMIFVMAARATQSSKIGTESRRMVCGQKGAVIVMVAHPDLSRQKV